MTRRKMLAAMLAWGAGVVLAAQASAQVGPGQQVSLRDILLRELRVRFVQERDFIDELLPHVGPGRTFSKREVLALMRKAQSKNRKFPFPYFRIMVQILASRRGLQL